MRRMYTVTRVPPTAPTETVYGLGLAKVQTNRDVCGKQFYPKATSRKKRIIKQLMEAYQGRSRDEMQNKKAIILNAPFVVILLLFIGVLATSPTIVSKLLTSRFAVNLFLDCNKTRGRLAVQDQSRDSRNSNYGRTEATSKRNSGRYGNTGMY